VSLWEATTPAVAGTDRTPPAGDVDADVVVVGAGFTGLWTARSLAVADPSLRIVVLEAERVGFGGSGRNGGWCSALVPMSLRSIEAAHGRDAAVRMSTAMRRTVDEVGAAAVADGIDCHWAKDGTVTLARSPAQLPRLAAAVAEEHRYGATEEDVRLLGAAEARAAIPASHVVGGAFTRHCAAVHPGRLVHGLARAVERRGVRVHEGVRVRRIDPRRVQFEHAGGRGVARADVVVRATEAFTARLPGHRRDVVPIYSLMVATEPLPASLFESLGWRGRATFTDGRHLVVYGQRTADGRIAFGGRGAPYHFGSAIDPRFDVDDRVHASVAATLRDLVPAVAGAEITHRWGGPVGAPRDWTCSVGFDRRTGLAWAGGYVGDGVGTSNLAGRTIADLVTGRSTELTTLPWVGHRSPRWEPEPLRWIGINAVVRLPAGADRAEARTGRPERWRSWMTSRVLGH